MKDETVYEIFDKNDLKKALTSAISNYMVTEKGVYPREGLEKTVNGLREFDVFDEEAFVLLVQNRIIRAFTVNLGKGVCAIDVPEGKILFMSARSTKEYELMVEKMVEIREDDPDHSLKILATLGQVQMLKKIGFKEIYKTVFIKNGIKFVPLKFDYIQIDSEI